MKRPCLDCGTPANGSRCGECSRRRGRIKEGARVRDRPHYRGDYQSRRRKLKEEQPFGPCGICGGAIRDPTQWTAHHVIAGDPDSELVPAHWFCNVSLGRG